MLSPPDFESTYTNKASLEASQCVDLDRSIPLFRRLTSFGGVLFLREASASLSFLSAPDPGVPLYPAARSKTSGVPDDTKGEYNYDSYI